MLRFTVVVTLIALLGALPVCAQSAPLPASPSASRAPADPAPVAPSGSASENSTSKLAQVASPAGTAAAAAPSGRGDLEPLANTGTAVEVASSPIATLPEAPRAHNTRNVLLASSLMFGSALFNAYAARRGGEACVAERYKHFAPFGGRLTPDYEFRRALTIQLPINAAVMALSLWKRDSKWGVILPAVASGVQFGIGATQISAGCF